MLLEHLSVDLLKNEGAKDIGFTTWSIKQLLKQILLTLPKSNVAKTYRFNALC